MLIPPVRAAVDRGEKLRLVVLLDEEFHGLRGMALSGGWRPPRAVCSA